MQQETRLDLFKYFLKKKLDKMLQKCGTLIAKSRINIFKERKKPTYLFFVAQMENDYYIFMLTVAKLHKSVSSLIFLLSFSIHFS